ncbi:nucleotidyltransferase domain-containing protein [bacterium]|nr:nucleotidyltransferase domain-containing protein [bacterium]
MYRQLKIGLFNVLSILEDYLSEIVLGGGFAPLIYYHYVIGDKKMTPIFTGDIDFMVRKKVPLKGKSNIDSLLKEAGFREAYLGQSTPPKVYYIGEIDGNEVEVEFLTESHGDGTIKAIQVQKGLIAEALKFISMSVDNTMTVAIDDLLDYGFTNDLEVKVPTPGAFVFHKGLAFTYRTDKAKLEKDLYYMFHIIRQDSMKELIIDEINHLKTSNNRNKAWFRKFQRNMSEYFMVEDKPLPKGVLSVSNQRPPDQLLEMDEDQFKNYVFFTFIEFLKNVL